MNVISSQQQKRNSVRGLTIYNCSHISETFINCVETHLNPKYRDSINHDTAHRQRNTNTGTRKLFQVKDKLIIWYLGSLIIILFN